MPRAMRSWVLGARSESRRRSPPCSTSTSVTANSSPSIVMVTLWSFVMGPASSHRVPVPSARLETLGSFGYPCLRDYDPLATARRRFGAQRRACSCRNLHAVRAQLATKCPEGVHDPDRDIADLVPLHRHTSHSAERAGTHEGGLHHPHPLTAITHPATTP